MNKDTLPESNLNSDKMNIVIVGHVDHGKSTFIGRLLADTGSLPEGKLEQVRATCKRNAKPFEYAFLLDALKDEQSQGITIDVARCFFKSKKRHYIIIDAPGHIEFLKNMITGAARAEAGLLLIDAKEGVQENSRRHGYMLSLLGIKQIIVLVNKMDLVDYSEEKFNQIVAEYTEFLSEINVKPQAFIPISAFEGQNLIEPSKDMPWYTGKPVLDHIDDFNKAKEKTDQDFRMPVQDIYKFTASGDDRRIISGTIDTGSISVGDEVVFYPSKKESKIKSIEGFNRPRMDRIGSGEATGFTMDTQIYINPGSIMCKKSESQVDVGSVFKANIFWLGKRPLLKNKKYKLKIGTTRAWVYLKDILSVLDASDLSSVKKEQVDRHDVAECIFQTLKPIAFDLASEYEGTSRFVIVDDYEISGGGIILNKEQDVTTRVEDYLEQREYAWERGELTAQDRHKKYGHASKVIVIAGPEGKGKIPFAKQLEKALFEFGQNVYYLGLSNVLNGLGADLRHKIEDRDEHIRRLGEMAHMFTDAGTTIITTISDLQDPEVEYLKALVQPAELVLISMGAEKLFSVTPSLELTRECAVNDVISQFI